MALVIGDVLSSAARAAPERLAVTLGDGALTFGGLAERSNRLANALSGWGLGRGARVAYWADISLEAASLQFALGRLGAAFAPLNPAYSEEEARAALDYLAPRLVIVDPAHAGQGEALGKELDLPIATLGGPGPGVALDELAARASASSPSDPLPAEDDVFTIFLTSGSTGRPKGVMVSQRATWLRTFAGSTATVTTGGKGQLVMFPLFHMAGWTFAYHAWSAHQPAHLVTRADAREILAAVERHRPGTLYCIPAVWQRIFEEKRPYDLQSLEWALIGTSFVEPGLLQEMKERLPGTRTTVSYGSTEVGRAISLADQDLFRKPGSIGLPVPGIQARVAGDGELLLASGTLMSGYFDLPDATALVLEDGWYHSGDLVEQDDDGYFCIVGRKNEIIRSGGESVAPLEVEAALRSYPGIADVAVIGVPDTRWGELVCAAVVAAEGIDPPTVDDLRRHLAGRLAAFKHPRRVLVVERLPRTSATGQVQRSLLAGQEATR
ncbi:MAG: class I adenylate-forming enzyme family protein [Acidimicrobiales bacterium]